MDDLNGNSQQYLSELEGGKRNPTIVTLNKVAIALGVTINDLVQPN
ncbi:helix-turn-helix domain-containing protein [Bartonella apihabitans]|nr:helix-turn-helix transcriptional regulator [Bartonella apihabitans]